MPSIRRSNPLQILFHLLKVFVRRDRDDFAFHAEKDLMVGLSISAEDLGVGEKKDLCRNPAIEKVSGNDEPISSVVSFSGDDGHAILPGGREMFAG